MTPSLPPASVLAPWAVQVSGQVSHWIAPDGCRDLIWWQPTGQRPRWKITPLVNGAGVVGALPGTQYRGWRLVPGALMDEPRLLARLARCDEGRPDDALTALADATRIDPHVHEALTLLARSPSVSAAVRATGMGERALERLTRQATGRTPTYWLALARVRRAAQALAGAWPLAELAHAHGYADQAHMTRAFDRWFGLSPARLRASHEALRAVRLSGYGDATALTPLG